MNYKFFTNSEKAWKAMFETISNAKKSIYLEMYIFEDNMKEFDFFNLLKEKAEQGLQVKIILDSLGSADLKDDAVFELEKAGVEILTMSYLLHRAHRKVLVVDERVAFVGGVNIYQTSRFWNDLMVKIKGNLVKKVTASFTKSYMNAGGKDPTLLSKNNRTKKIKMNTWIVEHSPVSKKFHLKRIYKQYLNKAEKSIILITPYFIPRRWIRAALHQAILRKVNIEVLIPKSTDHFFVDRVNYFYIYKLSKLGVRFYIEKEMNHAKAMIIDKREAMIGSQNLDFLSFDFNSEVGIFSKDIEVVSKLCSIVEEWKKDSILFDYKTYKPKWFDYVLSPLINLSSFFYRIFLD
ncbi:MAG: phosphatidylserine/phosphatidylglycerophosphate/cardiolipin synthase family protein [Candidatus Nomurabacteria bacterium]|nr:phosphatidylserine/phosphatidylglycerophosphate/cardiolipin synthase family protein [Candidatus Nomurabacteria bacterium]